jgi:hypothetical protein
MADSSINSFMTNFDGGARPNLYTFLLTVPGLSALNPAFGQLQFFCRSTQLPTSILGEITVPYLGRQAKYPGDRTYEDFTITVLNTQDMNLRRAFEMWNEQFNTHAGNTTTAPNPRAIFGSAVVTQLNKAYQPTRAYQFFDMFPRDVSSVDLAYDNNDTVSEFTVTFGYSYFIHDNSPTQSESGVQGAGFINPGAVTPGLAGVGNGFGIGANGFGGGGSGFGISFGTGQSGSGFSLGYSSGGSSFGIGYSSR